MTLLAAFTNDSNAFLVSDILYTSNTENVSHVEHAIYPVNTILTPEFWRSTLNPVQKAYIINPCLAVGMAGNYFTAKDLIWKMQEIFSGGCDDFLQIHDFLMDYIQRPLYPATLLGLFYDGDKVLAFKCNTDVKSVTCGNNFYEGTGGPALQKMLEGGALRSNTKHRTGNRPGPKLPAVVLHEVVELVFLQHNNGLHLLDEFGGGFQLIEFSNGQFRFGGNVAVIGCHSDIYTDNHKLFFEPAIVVQRYIEDDFVVAVCPMNFDQNKLPMSLELKTDETKYNVAENWLRDKGKRPIGDVWANLQIDVYALVITFVLPDKQQVITSQLLPRIVSDIFTFRLREQKSEHFIELGANFGRTLEAAYKHCLSFADEELRLKLGNRPVLLEYSDTSFEGAKSLLTVIPIRMYNLLAVR